MPVFLKDMKTWFTSLLLREGTNKGSSDYSVTPVFSIKD